MTTYKETIDYLFGLERFGIKLGLVNIKKLLDKLSSPQDAYRTVHISGTKGKGSTAATLESALMAAGYKVGLYTSPHLIDFKERVRVNQVEIDEESIVAITNLIRQKKEELEIGCEITFFEYTTALAFYYFMLKKVDIAIIEVGMGGRLDATNVIDPLVSVITSISLDHQQYLGETIREIAGEKAGIIKEKIPVISGATDDEAKEVIRNKANEKNAKLYELFTDFGFTETGAETFDYKGIKKNYKELRKNLLGDHQRNNFSLALAALEIINERGFPVNEDSIRSGLNNVKWVGRFEVFSRDPLLILDGAHNDKSMEYAINTIKKYFPNKKIISVIGIMKDKNIKGIIKPVNEASDKIILTKPSINRAAEPLELAKFFDKGKDVLQINSVEDALNYAKSICKEDSLIFVSGSLFTVGDARKALTS